ncbi:hypothetical protein BC828DRAFT_386673 [Blastocladiella britannica]|nr:hypothetical protein BC828DRAFT_386673 [Blastocladiella britannica]
MSSSSSSISRTACFSGFAATVLVQSLGPVLAKAVAVTGGRVSCRFLASKCARIASSARSSEVSTTPPLIRVAARGCLITRSGGPVGCVGHTSNTYAMVPPPNRAETGIAVAAASATGGGASAAAIMDLEKARTRAISLVVSVGSVSSSSWYSVGSDTAGVGAGTGVDDDDVKEVSPCSLRNAATSRCAAAKSSSSCFPARNSAARSRYADTEEVEFEDGGNDIFL